MANPDTSTLQYWWRGTPLDPRPSGAALATSTQQYWWHGVPLAPFPSAAGTTISAPVAAAAASALVPAAIGTTLLPPAPSATASVPTPSLNRLYAYDTYDLRTISIGSGAGDAEIGGSYSYGGGSSKFGVTGGKLQMAVDSASSQRAASLQTPSYADAVMYAKANMVTPTGNSMSYGVALRYGGLSDHIRSRVLWTTAGSVSLVTETVVGGVVTTIDTFSAGNRSADSGSDHWIAMMAVGSYVFAKFWKDGTTEPDWQTTPRLSQVAVTAAGGFAMRCVTLASNTNLPTVPWDSLSAGQAVLVDAPVAAASAAASGGLSPTVVVPVASATAAVPTLGATYVQSFVNTGTAGSAGSLVVNVPAGGCAVGNNLILAATGSTGNQVIASVADSKGNTWTVDKTIINGATVTVSVASARITSGLVNGDTITITYNSTTGGRSAVVAEYSGLLASGSVDSTAFGTATPAAATSGTVSGAGSTAQIYELVIGVFGLDSNGSAPVQGGGFNLRNSATSSGTTRTTVLEDATTTSTGTQTATLSWTGSSVAAEIVGAYKALYSPTPLAVAFTGNVAAPVASASASAPSPSITANILPDAASAVVSPAPPSLTITLFPSAATATASVPTTIVKDTILPGAPSATASIPTVAFTISATVLPPAAQATGNGPSNVAVGTVIGPIQGTATASAPTPSATIIPTVLVSAAAASVPTPKPVISMLPPAPLATGSVSGVTLAETSTVIAQATASAFSSAALIVDGSNPAPVSAASASVPATTITITVLPNAAAASASAPVPSASVVVQPPAPAAAGATSPTILLDISSTLSRASANVPQVTLKLTLLPPAPTATGSAPTPVITIAIRPAVAAAAGSAPLPTWTIKLFPPVSQATGSAPQPLVTNIVLAPSATAAASAPVPTLASAGTLIIPPASAAAATGAKLPLAKHHKGWKQRPILPDVAAMGSSVTEISVTMTLNWQTSPPAPGTYLSLDAAHRYNNQVFEYTSGWTPRTYTHTSGKGVTQTFSYGDSDSVLLSVVEDKTNHYLRHFALSLSEQAPIISTIDLIAGQDYRVDLVADCSIGEWVVHWKINLVDQPPIESNRAEYYARAVSASNWRQITLLPDTSEELNEFDVVGFAYDPAGSYPLP